MCLSKPMSLPLLPEIQQALKYQPLHLEDWIQHKRLSLSDLSLAQTETTEIQIIHEPPVELTTDVQAKVQKLEISSPVLGLTVPFFVKYFTCSSA